jgi:hypothetical protein
MLACLEQLLPVGSPSPFERLIAFGIYDGPTSGIIFCRDSQEPFLFRLLAWDERQKQRVFSLAVLDGLVVTETVRQLEGLEPANWPEWWLSGKWQGDEQVRVRAMLTSLTTSTAHVKAVVVSEQLLHVIQRARRISTPAEEAMFRRMNVRQSDEAEVTDSTFEEWLNFVNS